jgi:uncharacterized protein YgbK (DUF1537 family)
MGTRPERILLGCVADDFTGASDAASFLANHNMKTLLFNGMPSGKDLACDCDAVVIALKTRSVPAEEAVRETRAAFEWLKAHGTQHFYFKYCSTFDSTPKGNIGPVTDDLMEMLGVGYTLLCPALPVNKRIVKDGVLIVDGKPLAEGHMRCHPLNPMWDSRIDMLMEPQSKYPCLLLGGAELARPREEILCMAEDFAAGKAHCYVVPDYENEEQGQKISKVFGGCRLLTGGSGILAHMADRLVEKYGVSENRWIGTGTKGRSILLSGSCSKATRAQISEFKTTHRACAVFPERLASGEQTPERLWKIAQENPEEAVLFYTAGVEDGVDPMAMPAGQRDQNARLLEKTMAALARLAYDAGYTRIIAAGGETSGAVALELGFGAFLIGESIAPGVPVMTPLTAPNIRMVLKSGNFGQIDFFERALNKTAI